MRSTGQITIDPSGILRQEQGTQVSLRSDAPIAGDAMIEYNENEIMTILPNRPIGAQRNVSFPPFRASTTLVGGNSSHRFYKIDIVLLSVYNGASIRFVVTALLTGNRSYSPFVNLTVLCKTYMEMNSVCCVFINVLCSSSML